MDLEHGPAACLKASIHRGLSRVRWWSPAARSSPVGSNQVWRLRDVGSLPRIQYVPQLDWVYIYLYPPGLFHWHWGNYPTTREVTLKDMDKLDWYITKSLPSGARTMYIILVMYCTHYDEPRGDFLWRWHWCQADMVGGRSCSLLRHFCSFHPEHVVTSNVVSPSSVNVCVRVRIYLRLCACVCEWGTCACMCVCENMYVYVNMYSVSEATVNNMGKHTTWIHHNWSCNHKEKHSKSKTVCAYITKNIVPLNTN